MKVVGNMNVGDKFTLAGHYKRRTFWQWIRNKPKELKWYKVVAQSTAMKEFTEASDGK